MNKTFIFNGNDKINILRYLSPFIVALFMAFGLESSNKKYKKIKKSNNGFNVYLTREQIT